MGKLHSLKSKALENPDVKHAYDALEEEFTLVDQLLRMRSTAGLSQDELARKIGTSKSNISRMEKGRGNPSWNSLKKYAKACGFEVGLIYKAAN